MLDHVINFFMILVSANDMGPRLKLIKLRHLVIFSVLPRQ